MEKVKVSNEQFAALESFNAYRCDGSLGGTLEQILVLKMKKGFLEIREPLNEMDLECFINSLLNGYEL